MKKRCSYRIEVEDYEYFKDYCKRKNKTSSEVIRNVIKRFIEFEKGKKNE